LKNIPKERSILREFSRRFKKAPGEFILEVAQVILLTYDHRWIAYELIQNHKGAFRLLDEDKLENLGQGIDSWWTVDSFARTLSGPAWLHGQISDEVIYQWARSKDLWWRRAALVSTVALNVRSKGGLGDTQRTLAVCRLLIYDHEDMVVKAMSWALRELVIHDPRAVMDFIQLHEHRLAGRVKREVRNKLDTGLKYPKRLGVSTNI
jgi:3-methyladenine DNA glycosylase AlkD